MLVVMRSVIWSFDIIIHLHLFCNETEKSSIFITILQVFLRAYIAPSIAVNYKVRFKQITGFKSGQAAFTSKPVSSSFKW